MVRRIFDVNVVDTFLMSSQALPGLVEPDDVSGPYLYLGSPMAANMTGQSIAVDRGELPW